MGGGEGMGLVTVGADTLMEKKKKREHRLCRKWEKKISDFPGVRIRVRVVCGVGGAGMEKGTE
jgi:uncharacterized FAD-dependent dehydrogenase